MVSEPESVANPEGSLQTSLRATAAWDFRATDGTFEEEAPSAAWLPASGIISCEWCDTDSVPPPRTPEESVELEAHTAASSRHSGKPGAEPDSPERAEWDYGYGDASAISGDTAREQGFFFVNPKTLPAQQNAASGGPGEIPGKEAGQSTQPITLNPTAATLDTTKAPASPTLRAVSKGANTPPQRWELRVPRPSSSSRGPRPKSVPEVLPRALDEDDM